MSCCSVASASVKPKRHACPVNGKPYLPVPLSTIKQHIKTPWKKTLTEQSYFFCEDPDCHVVYFGEDDSIIQQSDIRHVVGLKDQRHAQALVCYCFDIHYVQAKADSSLEHYVTNETKKGNCACESQNPSSKCCLKDFKRYCR